MTDTNRPHHWRVIEVGTNRLVGDNLTHETALAYCAALEAEPGLAGWQYVMEPVRATLSQDQR